MILESESYGCGAAEGLGCGLAIAPVLEQIDTLEGVEESSVSWDGRYFRIELVPGSDPDRVAAEAASLLEGEACCVTASRGKAKPAEADQWFNSEETLALSRHEASVIASDLMAEVQAEVELEPDAAEKVGNRLPRGAGARLRAGARPGRRCAPPVGAAPRGWTRLEARIAELLSQDQARAVLATLEREIQE